MNSHGTINIDLFCPCIGLIQHFLHYFCTVVGKADSSVTLEMTFAVVQWFACTSRNSRSFYSPLVEFSSANMIFTGPATFLPVKRIANILAV